MIRLRCSVCGSVLQVQPELAGKVVRCGRCQAKLRVPGEASSAKPIRPPIVPRKPSPRPRPRPHSHLPWLVGLFVVVLLGTAAGVYQILARATPVSTVATAFDPPSPKVSPPESDKEDPRDVEPIPPPPITPEQSLINFLNDQRRREGSEPLTLDEKRVRFCQHRAEYLVRNLHQPFLDPREPLDVARGISVVPVEPREALRAWLLAPNHRAWLLSPSLKSLALAATQTSDGKWISVFDFTSGWSEPSRRSDDPVIYPTPGQADVPLIFSGNEVPDPIPDSANKLAGYPITVTFPPGRVVTGARATLEDEFGQEVPIWFSSPTRPANEQYPRHQQNTICLIPRQPLRAGTRYVAQVEAHVAERDWSFVWTFTTQSPAEYGERIYQRALQRLNRYREMAELSAVAIDEQLSLGCLAHARYLALNLDRVANLKLNEERDDLPGYSDEGNQTARQAMIRLGGGSGPNDALDWALASVLNRHVLLNPSLKTIGMGAEAQAPRGWLWVFHAPVRRHRADGPLAIVYPTREQTDVPLFFGHPPQSLLPEAKRDAVFGFAVSANFFPLHKIERAEAKLTDSTGNEVACLLSTPTEPLPGTGGYRQILLVPQSPLRPATKYTATMRAEVNGANWAEKWSFTTLDLSRHRKRIAELLLQQLNAARKQAGLSEVVLDESLSDPCQAHAEYVARNVESPAVQGLGIHDQDPRLPGATQAGAKAGAASVIAILPDPSDALEGWLATLYHRLPLLEPKLKRIGYGQSLHPLRGWVTVLDAQSGR